MRIVAVHVTRCTDIDALSLHDALPIFYCTQHCIHTRQMQLGDAVADMVSPSDTRSTHGRQTMLNSTGRSTISRSEEHTSELQSQSNLVCRLLLEKKKTTTTKSC